MDKKEWMEVAVKHFKLICKHKYYVGQYCWQAGLYKAAIFHDLSKYSPTEFNESVKFFTGTHSPIDEAKSKQGYSMAWLHHRGRNPHHYEYWVDNFDTGTVAYKMPFEYVVEMVCDFLGAGHAYSGDKFTVENELKWWRNNEVNKKAMHPNTKRLVDVMMYLFTKVKDTREILSNKTVMEILKTCYETGDDLNYIQWIDWVFGSLKILKRGK